MAFIDEIKRRRTFAVISHPDAGKTTLTEKLLLFGGAIHIAGAVKSNKIKKTATSDWMEIEKQRGISVATSVMAFEYNGFKINILDTPGHQDFQEDTFRTLTAVDSVIIVVDCAKGVESQTRKLMNVCRMRNTPVIVFVNKMDVMGADFYKVIDQIKDDASDEDAWVEDIALKSALERLTERERRIIRLRFFQGKTQMEIAEEIGISQAQISRLEKAVLEKLRRMM